MRYLIAGGSGLIGRHLTSSLAADGHEVVVLSRRPEALRALPAGARAQTWDGRTAAGWGELASGAVLVNLAGENIAGGRWTRARKRRLRDSRLFSSEAMVAAAKAVEPRPLVLLQGSAVGFYGDCEDGTIDETAPAGRGFLGELCVEWEEASSPVEALGVRRAMLRTGLVLARDGGALPKMLPAFRFGLGGPLGSGRQGFPWIHIADEVAAIRFLAEHAEAAGPFNLTAPEPVSNRDFARALGRALRRQAVLPAPSFALRLVFGEMADALLDGQFAVPRRLRELGFRFRFAEIGLALQDLLR